MNHTNDDAALLSAVSLSLGKATNVLQAIGDLYSADNDSFEGGNSFAAHTLLSVHSMLVEANRQAAELAGRLGDQGVREEELLQRIAALEGALAQYQAVDRELIAATTLADEQIEEREVNWPPSTAHREPTAQAAPPATAEQDVTAQTYDELVQKLTAVEVLAREQEQPDSAPKEQKLVPLVQRLREELERRNRVA